MEIKTLSGRQLVSTLLAAEAHLHLPLPPLLLVALYGRLPSFVGMNNASVVVQFLICVTYERAELAHELCGRMNEPYVRFQQIQSGVCFKVTLVAAEDLSTVLHPYVLFQDSC